MIELRSYRPGDERGLSRLFEGVFERPMSPDAWRWKLLGRPGDVERAVVGDDAGEVVFHVGGIPCAARIDGRSTTMVIAVDAMTRADRRGRGLLGQAYARILPRWREQGIELVLGLPNERAGFRYGWIPLFPLGWRVRLLRPERVLARRARMGWFARITLAGRVWNAWWDRGRASPDLALAEEHPAEPEIDALWARCAADADHGLVRDGAWHRWRYREVPGLRYRVLTARAGGTLQGLLCFRVREEEGRKIVLVAELLAPRAAPEVVEALLRGLVERAEREGVELVAALAIERSEREAVLARLGFLPSWGPFTVGCVPLAVDAETVRDPRRWALEAGCFDVV